MAFFIFCQQCRICSFNSFGSTIAQRSSPSTKCEARQGCCSPKLQQANPAPINTLKGHTSTKSRMAFFIFCPQRCICSFNSLVQRLRSNHNRAPLARSPKGGCSQKLQPINPAPLNQTPTPFLNSFS